VANGLLVVCCGRSPRRSAGWNYLYYTSMPSDFLPPVIFVALMLLRRISHLFIHTSPSKKYLCITHALSSPAKATLENIIICKLKDGPGSDGRQYYDSFYETQRPTMDRKVLLCSIHSTSSCDSFCKSFIPESLPYTTKIFIYIIRTLHKYKQ